MVIAIVHVARTKARRAALAAEEKKASEIVILDVALASGVADYLVICSAESERQVLAIHEQIDKVLSEEGHQPLGIEGAETGTWVLMDYTDVIVHIFKRGVREQYDLDRLWANTKRVPLPKVRAKVPAPLPRRRPTKERTAGPRG